MSPTPLPRLQASSSRTAIVLVKRRGTLILYVRIKVVETPRQLGKYWRAFSGPVRLEISAKLKGVQLMYRCFSEVSRRGQRWGQVIAVLLVLLTLQSKRVMISQSPYECQASCCLCHKTVVNIPGWYLRWKDFLSHQLWNFGLPTCCHKNDNNNKKIYEPLCPNMQHTHVTHIEIPLKVQRSEDIRVAPPWYNCSSITL